MFEELIKVGVEVILHGLLEKCGQPQPVRVVHQTIIVHSHHLVVWLKKHGNNDFAY